MSLGKLLLSCVIFSMVVTLAFAQTQPNLENGWKPYGSHNGSNLDTVNHMNGDWRLHAPLFPDFGQRGSLAAHYFMAANSKNWRVSCIPDTQAATGQDCYWTAGGTGVALDHSNDLRVHRTLDINNAGTVTYLPYGYSVITPDGSTHQMYGVPGTANAHGDTTVYESVDTTGYRINLSQPDGNNVLNTVAVIDRQGNQYFGNFGAYTCAKSTGSNPPQPGKIAPVIDDSPPGDRYCSQTAYLYQVTDTNGNQMSYNGPQNPNAGVDTLGRGQPMETGATTADFSDCVSRLSVTHAYIFYYAGPNGTTQHVKTCYAAFPFQTAFHATSGNTGVAEAQNYNGNYNTVLGGYLREQLVTVIQADGSKWTFDYDNYLEVTSVGLPTGGSISLTWTTINFANCNLSTPTPVSRAVATRTVNDNNGHSATWTYTWGVASNGTLVNGETSPTSDDTEHTFTALDPNGGGQCGFYETRTQNYQGTGASQQLLKQVDTTYSSTMFAVDTDEVYALGNVVPTSVKTTIYPSGKVNLVTKTYDSGLGASAPIFGNVVSEKVYDWGPGTPGPLLRETDTIYAWQINGNYLTAHLLDLPASVIVKDGNGTRLAETDYSYDESQYLTAANITTQHGTPPGTVRGNATTVSHWLNPGNSTISSHTNWYDTGEVYQQIDALGNTATHSYSPFYMGAYSTKTCNALSQCVSGTYDFSTGLLTSFTDANAATQASGNTAGDAAHTSTYSYDFMSRMTSATKPADASGNHPQTTFNYPNQTTVERLHKVTASLTDDAFTYFDGLGRSIRAKHVLPGGNNALADTSYDGLDRVASVTNPYFTTNDLTYGVIQNQYDALGRPTQTTRQDGSISTISYSDNCTTATDEAGKQRRACSDALGRLVSVDEPGDSTAGASPVANGGGSAATATVTISGSEQSKQVNSPPGGGGTPTCTPGQVCDGGGGGGGTDSIYDSGTVTISIGGHAYTVAFNVANTNVAANLAAAINADSLGVATAVASGGTISLQSRATGSQVSFSLSYSWTWDTTNFSNPSFTASGPNVLSGGTDGPAVFGGHTFATLYSYDALGNLVQVTQQGGTSDTTKWRVRSFTYDSLSRLLTANNPESGLITYFYDNNGNLTHKVMPSPNQTGTATHTVSYAHDVLNRVTAKAYSWQDSQNGTFPPGTAAVIYRYDEGTNGKGHLTSLTDQAGSATYTYDVLGRMVTETRTIAGVSKNMNYTYNLDSSVATMTYPSGAIITYTSDAAGRVLSAVDSGNQINYVTGAAYNAPGLLTGSTYGQTASFTGIVNQFSFNSRLQPVNLWSSSPTRTLMNLVYDFHVGNGDNGNVYAITNNRDTNRSQTFTYDALNRLLSAQNIGTDCSQRLPDGHTEYWGNTYVYDAWGNLNQKQVTKCSAENLSVSVSVKNQLQGYSYDAAGNMTQDNNGTNYTYDPENRISSASGFTYVYDADGNRVQKTNTNINPATATLYWYMTPGIVAESDLSGTLQSEYVFFGGERVARKDFSGTTTSISYYFSDHLKTASVISDATGSNIKSESDYYPWGGELQFANGDSNHYKFTGKERDAETGLDYFGARHYSSGLGRFITPDWAAKPVPIPYADLFDPQSFNQYTYVRNVPTTLIDQDGHQQESVDHLHKPPERTEQDEIKSKIRGAFKELVRSIGDLAVIGSHGRIQWSEGSQERLRPENEDELLGGAAMGVFMMTLPGPEEIEAALTIERVAASFGWKTAEKLGTTFVGEFANGARLAVNLGKVGTELKATIPLLSKISAETLRGIEKGAVNLAKAEGAKSVTITAKMTSEATKTILTKQGFTQVTDAAGKKTSEWTKTLKID